MRRALAASALLAALALTGCAQAGAPGEASSTPAPGAAGGLQDPVAAAAPREAGAPVQVDIPAIGVSSELESLSLGADRELLAPVDYALAGWFADGVAPGEIGPAIIAGHVDSAVGPAVFARLPELVVGDTVTVTTDTGKELTFEIYGSEQTEKATFPTSDVYGPAPTPELRLITCEGAFDPSTGHYTDNLILFARLVG